MFLLSKLIWIVLSPLNLLIIILFIGFLFQLMKTQLISRMFYLIALLFFITVGIFPTGKFLLSNLESKYPALNIMPNKIDGILILGGPTNPSLTHIHNQVSFNDAGERLTEAIKLIKIYHSSKIIFSGGSGSLEQNILTHSYVAKKFFLEMGIDINRIIFESKSNNTFENFLFSKKLINPKSNEKWLLITSSFHMTRAMNIAEKMEWEFIPYHVDFRTGNKKIKLIPSFTKILQNFNTFNLVSHEIVGLISYYFLGRTGKIF